MKKNDTVTLKIIDITNDGNGIGKCDNTVVFVPFTAVGDIVNAIIIKVNKNYCIGKLTEIITPSKDRCISDCESFPKCGGCSFRHINYESELKIKEKRVEDCIRRIGKIDLSPNDSVSDKNINRYRNKAQLPIGSDGKIGFYANHSHRIIDANDCLLQPKYFTDAVAALKKWVRKTNASVFDSETSKGILRHFYLRCSKDCESIMAVLVINGDDLPYKDLLVLMLKDVLGDRLKSVQLNINKRNNNVVLGYENKTIFGDSFIVDEICGIKVRISPNSFYQVNRDMAERLYEKAKEYACPKDKTIVDLYCGTGTIGLTMAKESKRIIGVEIIEDAIKDAKINAELNNIYNAEFICSDASNAVKQLKKRKIKPDVVILDPPRKGCDNEVLEVVANDFCPQKIVYVSCEPSTLARDLNIFDLLGYKLVEYTLFDLFPRTTHIETVALLGRKKVE